MMNDLDEESAAIISWLESADPDDWHRVALDFNWDGPLYVLDWIVRQDDCDMATALTIFWKGEPAYWIEDKQDSFEEPNGFSYLNRQICTYIANRVALKGYTRSKIDYDPNIWAKKDFDELIDLENSLTKTIFKTHPHLMHRCRGRKITNDRDFYRRYPANFHNTIMVELPDHNPRSIALRAHVKLIAFKTMLRRLAFSLRA